MTLNAWLHPIVAFKRAVRRMTLTADLKRPDLPAPGPMLEHFAIGETLPWKGITFKVGKIVGGDFPMVILVPSGRTHGAKLRGLRTMRDIGRHELAEQRATKKSLAAATR